MSPSDLSNILKDLTLTLCNIPSVTGEETEICNWIEQRFCSRDGWIVNRRQDSLWIEQSTTSGTKPLIVLAGHLDTVPPRQDRAANVDGDWLEACGASDMKGALAVMIHLVETVDVSALPVDLGLVFYSEEEGPYERNQLRVLLAHEPRLKQADLVVCMEPTNNAVQVGCMGGIHASLTFAGKRAHSARPWQGENAIQAAGPLLTRLNSMEAKPVSFETVQFWEVASITTVNQSGTRNVIPDHLELNLNLRFAPNKSVDEALEDIAALVDGDCEVTITDVAPSGHVCLDNPWMQSLVAHTGRAIEPKQAWTDVAQFSEIGVDAINFGPGDTTQAHQQNEGIRVSAMVENYRLLVDWLGSINRT